jgi:methylase of polypeptide subunit release factors
MAGDMKSLLQAMRCWLARYLVHRSDVSKRHGQLTISIPAGTFRSDLGLSTKTLLRVVSPIVSPNDRVLDVGTGCGLVALTLAARCKAVVGVDVNPTAIRAALENAKLNRVENVKFMISDLVSNLDTSDQFDLVIFNPPGAHHRRPRNYLETAFFDYNYETITRLFAEIRPYLSSKARIIIPYEKEKIDTVDQIARTHGFRRTSCLGRGRGIVTVFLVHEYQQIINSDATDESSNS